MITIPEPPFPDSPQVIAWPPPPPPVFAPPLFITLELLQPVSLAPPIPEFRAEPPPAPAVPDAAPLVPPPPPPIPPLPELAVLP